MVWIGPLALGNRDGDPSLGIKARNVYVFMGHSPELFDDVADKAILTNGILWAAGRN